MLRSVLKSFYRVVLFVVMCAMCISVWACVLCSGTLRRQRLQLPVELELGMVVNHQSWVPEIKLGCSARSVSILCPHSPAIPLAPEGPIFITLGLLHTGQVLFCDRFKNAVFTQ